MAKLADAVNTVVWRWCLLFDTTLDCDERPMLRRARVQCVAR